MSETAQPKRLVGRNILLLFAGAIALSALYDTLRPKGGPSPDLEARLRCIAQTVAFHQAVYAVGKTDMFDQVDALSNDLFAHIRRMEQSDDPARLHYRPIMIEEEAARDAAVAADPDGYFATTWVEVQACADDLGLRASS